MDYKANYIKYKQQYKNIKMSSVKEIIFIRHALSF